MALRDCGSTPTVGSSSRMSSGSCSKAPAMFSRRFMPPLKLWTRSCADPPARPAPAPARLGRAVARLPCRTVRRTAAGLPCREFVEQRHVLRHQPDSAFEVGGGARGIHAHHAAGGLGNAADHCQCAGLARSVGSQQAHALAALDAEADAPYSNAFAVALGQILYFQYGTLLVPIDAAAIKDNESCFAEQSSPAGSMRATWNIRRPPPPPESCCQLSRSPEAPLVRVSIPA